MIDSMNGQNVTQRPEAKAPVDAVQQIRKEVERMGGSVGVITSTARWVQLDGIFTPEQLRRLAKAIEKSWKDRS